MGWANRGLGVRLKTFEPGPTPNFEHPIFGPRAKSKGCAGGGGNVLRDQETNKEKTPRT